MAYKNHLLTLIIPLIFFSNQVFAQDYFELIPFPDTMKVHDIANGQQGDILVAAESVTGSNSKILRSSNHGESWEIICDIEETFKGVCINSSGEIYAVSRFGNASLFRSVDNGQTWMEYNIPNFPWWYNLDIYSQGNDTLYVTQNNPGSRLLRSVNDGQQWDSLFAIPGTSMIISGLAIGANGILYISVYGHLSNKGGLYRSTDNGITWELFGLENNYLTDVAFNSSGDLFITSCGLEQDPGLYAVYAGEEVVTPVLQGPLLVSLEINSSDDIFAGDAYCNCIYHSNDNGATYEWIIQDSVPYPVDLMEFDSEQFLYVSKYGSVIINRSIESTITSVVQEDDLKFMIWPNPAREVIYGSLDRYMNGDYLYEIINQMGRKVRVGSLLISEGKFELNVSCLKSGIYIIKIYTPQPVTSFIQILN